jgi:hypothetical protein
MCATALGGCDGALLDVGSGDAGPPDAIATAVPDASRTLGSMSCPAVSDQEIQSLRGTTCTGVCGGGLLPGRDLSSAAMLAASLTATWSFCAGSLGPPGSTGAWVLSNCGIVFLPVTASDAGTATYDVVVDDAGAARGIVLHLATGDLPATVTASACLGRADLAFDGGTLELASLSPPDASTAK